MFDLKSFFKGIWYMHKPFARKQKHQAKYVIKFINPFEKVAKHRLPSLWIHLWTPKWHCGRGPYISIGIGVFAIYRGY